MLRLNATKQTFLCLLLLSATITIGQKRVLLFIKNPHQQAIYKIGDEITFRFQDSAIKHTYLITLLCRSGASLNHRHLGLGEVV